MTRTLVPTVALARGVHPIYRELGTLAEVRIPLLAAKFARSGLGLADSACKYVRAGLAEAARPLERLRIAGREEFSVPKNEVRELNDWRADEFDH